MKERKWTKEKIADLKNHVQKSWPFLEKRFKCSQRALEHILSRNKIRKGHPQQIVWTDKATKILIEGMVESHKFNPHTSSGQKELRKVRAKMVAKIKKAGFEGRTSFDAFVGRLKKVDKAELARLGFSDVDLPISWGMPADEVKKLANVFAEHRRKLQSDKLKEKIGEYEKKIRTLDDVAERRKNIPTTDHKTAFNVKAAEGEESIKFIGSMFIGLSRPSNTYELPISNTLREAEARRLTEGKPDVVILTGDIIYLDTIRYSNLTAKRSLLEDIPLVPEVIEDDWVLRQIEEGSMVFLTFKEKLEMALRVVREIFAPGGKPIFNGRILGCLGRREEEIANYMANERANAEVGITRANFVLLTHSLRYELKEAIHNGDDLEANRIKAEIRAIEIRLRERLKATSIWRKQIKDLFEKALKYIAVRLEDTIPNLEIVSTGESFIRVGSQLNEIKQKGTESPNDTLEGRMIGEFSTRATAGENVPDLTVGGGLNPVFTRGEIDQARGEFTNPDMRAPFSITAPTIMPSEYLRGKIKDIYGATTAGGQAKLIRSRDFTGGAFDMNWVNGFPMVRYWTDTCLSNKELWGSQEAVKELIEGNYMFYELVSGCEHRGQNWQAYFDDTPDGPQIFTDALWKFILKYDPPIHMVHFLGDKWTGHNFPGKSYQKPEKWLTPDQVRSFIEAVDLWPNEKERALEILRSKGPALRSILREFESGKAPTTFNEKYIYFRNKISENAILSGIDALDLQRESWERECLPLEAEIVARALKRAHNAGIATLGHNIGLVICETGNHVANTENKALGRQIKEGSMMMGDFQKAVKMAHPELWNAGRLHEEIVSPTIGISTKTEGLFGQISPEILSKLPYKEREKYLEYRMAAKHKGAQGGSKYTDLIRVIRSEDAKRGRRRAHGQKYSVSHFGHSHYCFSTFSRNRYLTTGGCHTFDDPYGEEGNYRLTSVCVTIHGFPIKGPAWGPITEVHLRFAELKEYMKKPWPIDVKRLFPNAV